MSSPPLQYVVPGPLALPIVSAISIQPQFFDVRAYGALVDGVTDDTSAVNAAMAAATAAGGGTVFFPGGTCLVTSTIALPKFVEVKGQSCNATKLQLSSASAPQDVLQAVHPINASTFTDNRLTDLTITCGPVNGLSAWAASSSAFTIGQYYRPATTASVLLKLVSGSGPTGAHRPIGMLTPASSGPYLQGAPASNIQVDVNVIVGGFLGAMTFQVSTNGGSTYGSTQSTAAGNSYAYTIPATSVQIVFPNTTYSPGVLKPSPQVVVSGSPNADYIVDVVIITGGALGTMQFQVATNGSDKFGLGTYGGTQNTVAGASFAYAIPGTGLTITFYAGDYSASGGGPSYLTPIFGWSLFPGTQIVDGGYTWQVIAGPSCYADTGGASVILRNVQMIGGVNGIVLDQTQNVSMESVIAEGASHAGLWCCGNGDHTFGAGGQFTNAISVTGKCQFVVNGWGILYDGGVSLSVGPGVEFFSNTSGWMRIAGANGVSINGIYIEDTAGLSRNTSYNSRASVSKAFAGLSFVGSYLGTINGNSVLDCWTGDSFSCIGCVVGGSVAGFTGFGGGLGAGGSAPLNVHESGNINSSALPILDGKLMPEDGHNIPVSSGTVVLTPGQYRAAYFAMTGSLTGNVTVVLPAIPGAGPWMIDATAVTLNGFTITMQANGINWSTTIGTTLLYQVQYGGIGKLYGQSMAA
jgi:hypothetical protein